jgi:hypothetical protein
VIPELGKLLILYLLAKNSDKGGTSSSSPAVFPPAKSPPLSPPAPGATTPVTYTSPHAHKWVPYAPLTTEVIARAQTLLSDPTFTTELVEPDAQFGKVRYLRVHPSPGHTSVTAWKPNPAAPSGVAV